MDENTGDLYWSDAKRGEVVPEYRVGGFFEGVGGSLGTHLYSPQASPLH